MRVEMMTTNIIQPLSPDLVLPWSPNAKQEALFDRWTKRALVVLLLFFIIIPWLPVFEKEYIPPSKKIVKTKVVLEADQLIPPKPVVVKPKAKPKPVPKPKPKPEKSVPTKDQSKPSNKPVAKQKDTKAALSESKGFANLSSQLAALRGKINAAGMKKKKISSNKKGMVATVDRGVLGENRATQANLGIDVDENVMKNVATELADHQTSNVEGVVSLGASEGTAKGRDSNYSYVSGMRDADNIRQVIERKKGLILALYYDALNDHPDLQGKFIFKMIIQPNGKVTNLILVSSELDMAELEQQMLSRIQLFDFGVEDVSATPVEYRFVFIPS